MADARIHQAVECRHEGVVRGVPTFGCVLCVYICVSVELFVSRRGVIERPDMHVATSASLIESHSFFRRRVRGGENNCEQKQRM